jgi:hypothetical protein
MVSARDVTGKMEGPDGPVRENSGLIPKLGLRRRAEVSVALNSAFRSWRPMRAARFGVIYCWIQAS